MSELKEAIAAAGAENVANLLQKDPAFTLLNLTWREPSEIGASCEKLGLTTLQGVIDWVQRINGAAGNAAAFAELIDPSAPVQLQGLAKVPWAKLHEAIHATGLLASDCMLHNSDAHYHLPTKAQWDAIAAACPSKRRRWVNETQDCDDFVRMALGWLASKGLGNVASAFVATRHYAGTNPAGGHAAILVWDNQLTPWQWEPQSGKLYPASYAKLGGNFLASRIEYARVFA